MRVKCLLDEGVRQRRVSKKGDEELGVFPSLVYEVSLSSTVMYSVVSTMDLPVP
jgi:hypothetical protein